MTQEEKAKSYDEALKAAIVAYKDEDRHLKATLERIFPELAESEDEKIRKELVSFLQLPHPQFVGERKQEKWIAWLEKQVEQKPKDRYTFNSIPRLLEMIEPTDRAKAYCQKLIDSLLKEGYFTDAKIVGECLKKMNGEDVPIATMDELKNKVEPKFKVGDWIVENGVNRNPIQITSFEEDKGVGIKVWFSNGTGTYIEFLKGYHLWTIKDAKDGDVLANDHHILILKELVYDWSSNGTPYSVKAYCGIKPNGNFEIGKDNWCFCGTLHIHPATKEQRDTLMKAMADAGYTFDFDKKELKEINVIDEGKAEMDYCFTKMMNGEKVSPTWSEEDEKMVKDIIAAIDTLYYHGMVNWLKHIKDRVQPQNTWKPSDEQIDAIRLARSFVVDDFDKHPTLSEILIGLEEQLKRLKG